MLTFDSEGNAIDFLYQYAGAYTQRFCISAYSHETVGPSNATTEGRTTKFTSYDILNTYNYNSTSAYSTDNSTEVTWINKPNPGDVAHGQTLIRISEITQGELTYSTKISTLTTFRTTSPTISSSFSAETITSITNLTTQITIIGDVADTIESTSYFTVMSTVSATYPLPYIGIYYTTEKRYNGSLLTTSFVSSSGSTSTIGSLTYLSLTYLSQEITVNVTTKGEIDTTRLLAQTYQRGNLGRYYVVETSNKEGLIVLNVNVLNTSITEGCLTDIASYSTTTEKTLLFQLYTNTFIYTPTKGLFSTISFNPTLPVGLILNSPDVNIFINSAQTVYTIKNTNFVSAATFTYFSESATLPLGSLTSAFSSATSFVNTPATVATPSFGFFNGASPLINNRQSSLTTKSTIIPGLGVFPFDLNLTASRNGIREYIDIQTCYLLANRSVSVTSKFTFAGADFNDFYPDIDTFSTVDNIIGTDHRTESYFLSHSFTSEFPNEQPLSIRVVTPSAGPTLYSNFIIPGIRAYNNTGEDVYKNISILGANDIYELNKITEFESSFYELFVLSTFTNLRSFQADDLKINYIKWLNSERIAVTILNEATLEELTYTVSYDELIPKSYFYTTKQLTNNASVIFDTTYQFGGPNRYSKSEMMLLPAKGKYDITRYNLLENSSSSTRLTLNQFDIITCGTNEYVKYVVMPYITFETALANLKHYLDSTVMIARDIEE